MSRFHIRAARILARTHAPTHKKGRQIQIQSCVFVYLCVWLCQATNGNNFFTKNLFWFIEQLKIAVVEIYIQLVKFLTLVWRELLQCEKCWQPRLFMQIRGLNSLSDLYYRKWFLKIFSVRPFLIVRFVCFRQFSRKAIKSNAKDFTWLNTKDKKSGAI